MKQKKFRLPRLYQRARLARNLFFAAFLVIASWVCWRAVPPGRRRGP